MSDHVCKDEIGDDANHVKYRLARALSNRDDRANSRGASRSVGNTAADHPLRLTPLQEFAQKCTALLFACTVTFGLYAACDASFRSYASVAIVNDMSHAGYLWFQVGQAAISTPSQLAAVVQDPTVARAQASAILTATMHTANTVYTTVKSML